MSFLKRSAISFAMLAMISCGGTTGGGLLNIPFLIGGAQRDPSLAGTAFTIQSPTGWTVSLSHALIAVGPFYFNVTTPSTDEFRDGTVIIQATQQVIVDVLDPTLYPLLNGANGETGTAVDVEVDLFPPDGTEDSTDSCLLASPLGNPASEQCPTSDATPDSQVFVEGVATNESGDGGTIAIPFKGWVTINQAYATAENIPDGLPAAERVAGASCNLNFTSNNQTLVLQIDPTHWFDATDFGAAFNATPLEPGYSRFRNGEYTWTNSTTFFNQIYGGVTTSTGVYNFSFLP